MGFAHSVAKKLTNYPVVKQVIKDAYAFVGNVLSDKQTDLTGLKQVSSEDCAHNFGYYDKCPWSADQRYMIYVSHADAHRAYVSKEPTPIVLCDLTSGEERIIAHTNVWNSQQGCMLQWLGPDYQSRILYNDFRDGSYCSVIHHIDDSTETVLKMPVYSVSADGKTAVTLDFSRLNTFGPGYGYCNLPDETKDMMMPDSACMWRLDLEKNEVSPLPLTYYSLAQFEPIPGMQEGFHKINHIMLNPSADRFMFIQRWIVNGVKHHRLLTCNTDGSDLYVLLDHGMVSHNNWQNDKVIVSFCHSNEHGDAYHILHDKSQQREAVCSDVLKVDGHPSFSPDGAYMITDCYPDFKRKQALFLVRVADWKVKKLGNIYANPRYLNDTRCDLHPRWNRDSTAVCIDGACGKYRQVFTVEIHPF